MTVKQFCTLALLGSVLCLPLRAGAATLSLSPDPRVDGNTAAGWSYADVEGEVVNPKYDVKNITGSLNLATNTLSFTFTTVENRTAGPVRNEAWSVNLDLDLEDEATLVDANYYILRNNTGWTQGGSGLVSRSYTHSGSAVTLNAVITDAQADAIYHNGFQFAFNVGAGDGNPGDVATVLTGRSMLYVVPVPNSMLLIGAGLGLLTPALRRRKVRG